MKSNTVSTRRRFFWKAGAVLSAPIAATQANTAARAADDSALAARLALLEDVNAILKLHESYARLLSCGAQAEAAVLFTDPGEMRLDDTICRLSSDRFGELNTVEVATDGGTATAMIHCTVEIETMIEPHCTLVDMARGQGEGVVRRTETRMLEGSYVKRDGVWKIARTVWHPAPDPY